jgi:hypothetical protein
MNKKPLQGYSKFKPKHKPLNTLPEIAEMLGVKIGTLQCKMRDDPDKRPFPRLTRKDTGSTGGWWLKEEVINWWRTYHAE